MLSYETWVQLLANPPFKFCFFTFLATCVSLLIKFSARPGGATREDWAFGFDLAQVSIFTLLTDGTAKVVNAFAAGETVFGRAMVGKLIALQQLLFIMVVVLFGVARLVQHYGWKNLVPTRVRTYRLAGHTRIERSVTRRAPELNWFGVLFPLPLGIFYLAIVVVWIAGE